MNPTEPAHYTESMEEASSWSTWPEQRRQRVFGWLLLLVFLIQNLGIWTAWQAGSPMQTTLNVLGGGCTLYLLLSNVRSAVAMPTTYRVGASFLALRLSAELLNNFLTAQPMTTVQYQEAALLMAFLVAILPRRVSAALTGLLLSGILALTVKNGLHQIFEFLMLLVTAGVLPFTAEYGRQALNARRRVEELERQLIWDPLTGVANHQLIQERARTYMLSPSRSTHLTVLITVNESTTTSEGRQALQLVVKAIKPLLRETDSIGRWNDDTLLLLFPHVHSEQRQKLLRTLSSALTHLKTRGLLPQDVQISSAFLNEAPTPEEVVTLAHAQLRPVTA